MGKKRGMWLLDRLNSSTLVNQPNFRFALLGSINWLRALAILCEDITEENFAESFSKVQRRPKENPENDTLVLENLLKAYHNLSFVQSNSVNSRPYISVRAAIVSWYYSIYFAAKAMIAAQSGADPQQHSTTANQFQRDIVDIGSLIFPFNLHLTSLVDSVVKTEVESYRKGNNSNLNKEPTDTTMAFGGAISYLKGTQIFEKQKKEKRIIESSEFKKKALLDFRKKEAQLLRDDELSKSGVNFLHQAFRFRGKANYRDSIYLSYGDDYSSKLICFSKDLAIVANSFSTMASHFCSKRIKKGDWELFINDVSLNSHIPLSESIVKLTIKG